MLASCAALARCLRTFRSPRGPEATALSLQAAAPRNRERPTRGAPNALHRRRPRYGLMGEGRPRQARALPSLLVALHGALPSRRTLGTRGTRKTISRAIPGDASSGRNGAQPELAARCLAKLAVPDQR